MAAYFKAFEQLQPAKAATMTEEALHASLGDWLQFFRDNKGELLDFSQLAEAMTMARALAN